MLRNRRKGNIEMAGEFLSWQIASGEHIQQATAVGVRDRMKHVTRRLHERQCI
jgi:hypothetical protein